MPKPTDKPASVRPFLFHGVDLEWEGREHAQGECPFCGKRKLTVRVSRGTWGCFVCGQKGNALEFTRRLWEASREQTSMDELASLAEERRLLRAETPLTWGAARSALTGDWLLPGWHPDGRLWQVYRWTNVAGGGRRLLPTPALHPEGEGHGIFRAGWDSAKIGVWLCEGPWDGMALWEALGLAKEAEDGALSPTADPSISLLAAANVLALPGCGSVGEPMRRWLSLFDGRAVTMCFDSDHPASKGGRAADGAGWAAAKRAAALLRGRASSISWLAWGEDGFDPALPTGYDVRDLLAGGK